LLADAGLVSRPTNHDAEGKGRRARRQLSELSFHSLRHTATSMMKNAGISPAVVQDIIGHDSAEMNTHYTHIDHETKRKALESLPDLSPIVRSPEV
jgi:integrase